MRVTDVFNTRNFQIDLEQTGVRQQSEYKWLTRRVYFSISYKFGNLDDKRKEKKEMKGGGGDGEM